MSGWGCQREDILLLELAFRHSELLKFLFWIIASLLTSFLTSSDTKHFCPCWLFLRRISFNDIQQANVATYSSVSHDVMFLSLFGERWQLWAWSFTHGCQLVLDRNRNTDGLWQHFPGAFWYYTHLSLNVIFNNTDLSNRGKPYNTVDHLILSAQLPGSKV